MKHGEPEETLDPQDWTETRALAHRMVEGGGGLGDGPSILQLGGLPDSCYIWRADGPGLRMRDAARRAGGMQDRADD